MTDVYDLPPRTAVDRRMVARRVEGAALTSTTVAIPRLALDSCLCWATTDTAIFLAHTTLHRVCGRIAHPNDARVRFVYLCTAGAGGRLNYYRTSRHGRVLRTLAAWLAREE